MVSPNLATKKIPTDGEEMNENAKKLFQAIYNDLNREDNNDDETPRIQVSELISKMAFFYEKVRNAVDYEEDHLLRKNAIARILRRQVIIEGLLKVPSTEVLARHLLEELIRGSYLPNNKLPEIKVAEVARTLDKYLRLRTACLSLNNSRLGLKTDINKAKNEIQDNNRLVGWLLTLAACEIEENLGVSQTKRAMVNIMFDSLIQIIKLPVDMPYNQDLEIQIYLSVGRNYARFDDDMLAFVLFKYYNQDWVDDKIDAVFTISDEKIAAVADNITNIRFAIDEQLKHPLRKELDRIVHRYALYFSVLQETIDSNPAKVYNEFKQNPKNFFNAIRKVCNSKYKKAKSRLWRAALRSIIYIFLTKSIFVFLIEIPAINWFNEPLNVAALAINVSFPAVLLFLIVSFTRVPGEDNTDRIVEGVREIALIGHERQQAILLRNLKKRHGLMNFIFNIVYTAAFFVSVYFIIWVLDKMNFTWVSMIIFLFFLAFVSFFSIIVTRGVKELLVVEKKDNLISFLIDLFYMPIIMAGKWLSNNVSKVNVFVFIFDFIIEAPFKILVDVAEEWTKYVKERKDNVV
ncbi:MAG: hypothetical protein PHE20_02215 [Patescibacteria group bacterium]|nr:hypothetical protein [Patescibacteria group bacterium]